MTSTASSPSNHHRRTSSLKTATSFDALASPELDIEDIINSTLSTSFAFSKLHEISQKKVENINFNSSLTNSELDDDEEDKVNFTRWAIGELIQESKAQSPSFEDIMKRIKHRQICEQKDFVGKFEHYIIALLLAAGEVEVEKEFQYVIDENYTESEFRQSYESLGGNLVEQIEASLPQGNEKKDRSQRFNQAFESLLDLRFDEKGNEIGDRGNYWRVALAEALEYAEEDDYDEFMTTLGEQATKSKEQILLLETFNLDVLSNKMFKSLLPLSLRLHQHYDIINHCFPHILQILHFLYLLPYHTIRRWEESIQNEWKVIQRVVPEDDLGKKDFIFCAVSYSLSSSKKIQNLLENIADQITVADKAQMSEEEGHEITEGDSSSSSDSDSEESNSSSDSGSEEDSSSNSSSDSE